MKSVISSIALTVIILTNPLFAEEESSFSRGVGEGVGKVLAEKLLEGLAGAFEWTPGAAHPSAPHVVASNESNKWRPASGYRWVSESTGDLRVLWTPGRVHSANKHIIAQEKEGMWRTAPGYKWVNLDDPNDFRVIEASIVGIGVVVELNKETNTPQIIKITPGSPADQAGLTVGLFINKVDAIPTTGKSLDDTTSLLRGEVASTVHVEVFDSIRDTKRIVPIIRKRIDL